MYDNNTIKHICQTRLETVTGMHGFLNEVQIRRNLDSINVVLWMDIDNLKIRMRSEFDLKPNFAKRELLNEIDEIADGIKHAQVEAKWLPRGLITGMRPVPGTGLRGRWKDRATGEIIEQTVKPDSASG